MPENERQNAIKASIIPGHRPISTTLAREKSKPQPRLKGPVPGPPPRPELHPALEATSALHHPNLDWTAETYEEALGAWETCWAAAILASAL